MARSSIAFSLADNVKTVGFFYLFQKKKELELRIETQKQTLQSRDESIKKLLEMLQNKGLGECVVDQVRPSIALRRYRLR